MDTVRQSDDTTQLKQPKEVLGNSGSNVQKPQRTSARISKPTEKNKAFLSSQTLHAFKQSCSVWKKRYAVVSEFLGSEQDHSVVPKFIQLVEDDFNLVTENFRMLLCLEEENLDSSIKSKYESIKSEMSHVMSRMSNAYPGCFDKRSCKDSPSSVAQGGSYIEDTLLQRDHALAKDDHTKQVENKVDRMVSRSARSVAGSRASSKGSHKSEAAAAVLKAQAKLKQIDLNKSLIELEQKKIQLELEQIHATDDLEKATSELEAASDAASLADVASERGSVDLDVPTQVDKHKQVKAYLNSLPEESSSDKVVKVLCDQLTLSRLPLPEPGVFTGEPLQFPSWERAFDTLMANKSIPECERLHYLSKYLGGDAKSCVEGYFLLATPNAYEEARKLLSARYGHSFSIGKAFWDKLNKWPRIHYKDAAGLRKFADFLHQCVAGMEFIPSLRSLENELEHGKIFEKLPTMIVKRWGREVYDWEERHRKSKSGYEHHSYRSYPPFIKLVEFLTKEANVANNPVTSFLSSVGDTQSDAKPERKQGARKAVAHAMESQAVKTCRFCDKSHHLSSCPEFRKLPYLDKKAFVFKERLCYCCLNGGHISKKCRNRAKCEQCNGKHPTSLHSDDYKPTRRDDNQQGASTQGGSGPSTSESTSSHSGATCMSSVSASSLSAMIVPVYVSSVDAPTKEKLVYALLDTQSDRSFILESTYRSLGVRGTSVQFSLSTMTSENKLIKSERVTGLTVRAFDSEAKLPLPSVYTRSIIPSNRSHIPTASMALKWPHLERVGDKLMPITDAEVGLLIGYNCPRALAPREIIVPEGDGPYAQRTDLGWGIVGVVDYGVDLEDNIGFSHRVLTYDVPNSDKTVQVSVRSHTKECVLSPREVLSVLERDFKDDDHSDSCGLSQEDKKFMDIVSQGVCRTSDGHYQMPLPFKHQNIELSNNIGLAQKRLEHLKTKLAKDTRLKSEYVSFMSDMVSNGWAEKVEGSDLSKDQVWYIPHHGVYNSQKNKLRVVFDCSARSKGKSLNDLLLQGPDLTNTLVGVLCRFREEDVAFCCDVAKMFYQFRVDPKHRDYMRFLWWDHGNLSLTPSVYRMTVHLFGAASSPSCSNFGLRQIAFDYESQFGLDVGQFLRENFYVDDGLKSVCDEDTAVSLVHRTIEMCKQGGLKLHKFISNSRTVLESIPSEFRVDGIQKVDLRLESLPVERTLGVEWCVESDTFQFRVTIKDRPYTRRGLLSTVASVYDPLGFISPFTLKGKRLLQTLCIEGRDWDDPISDELRAQWEQWLLAISDLEQVKLNRCIKPKGFKISKVEFHHFSDASVLGYGQCSYLRLLSASGQVHVSLLSAKARVAPIKPVTIPRLELSAAVVSVKASLTLASDFTFKGDHFFWTDSKVVLGYIANEARRFHMFVANRVGFIHSHTDTNQWHHVRGASNVADIASRGAWPGELIQSRWFDGPEFLWELQLPDATLTSTVSDNDPELRSSLSLNTSSVYDWDIDRFNHVSSWFRLKKVVAICLAYRKVLRARVAKDRLSQLYPVDSITADDLLYAESEIVRIVQSHCFKDEITRLQNGGTLLRSSPLFKLHCFLDKTGILRVGGRLRNSDLAYDHKHPIVLPKSGHVTQLIVADCHEKIRHQGRGMTLNETRNRGFWIVGGSSVVAKYVFRCVSCRKLRANLQTQIMADLPQDRASPSPPFTFVGVDYFGPFVIKEKRKELKRWGVLFTCLSSRAVHLEVSDTLTTSSFLNALRRFICLRGPIQVLRCDQGTNFVGADNELKAALNGIDNVAVRDFLLQNDCVFEFKLNPPGASHMGGAWERLIRSVRSILGVILSQHGCQLDDESLRTYFCEITAIINGRPLTLAHVNDPDFLEPLTPNHLLTAKSRIIVSPPATFQRTDVYAVKRWRRVQYLVDQFWSRWKSEYVHHLQSRSKWQNKTRNIQVGDIVVLKEENVPRNMWKLGRIASVNVGADQYVRSVKILMGDSNLDKFGRRINKSCYLERPIHKIVVLVEADL